MSHLMTRRAFLGRAAAVPVGIGMMRRGLRRKPLMFYAGTYTDNGSEGIYQCVFDASSGAIEVLGATGGIENPSYLALHPTRPLLFAVSETTEFGGAEGGGVYAYAIESEDGALRELNAQPTHGGAPCYVSTTRDGEYVLVANYLGGNVAAFPVESDGRLAAASSIQQHEGSSVNARRQEAPHAHCIIPDPEGAHVLAVDLGIDQVVIYRLDGGKLTRVGAADLHPGAGPRHVAFHPSGSMAFVINELDSTITSFRYAEGAMEPLETISTLPSDFEGTNICADIHVSADGRFVYGSNRGHNSIVVLAVAESGSLDVIQHISTGGDWPRNFALDPTGQFLLAANQRSDNIVVFAIDLESGSLRETGSEISLPSPVCIRFRV